MEALLERFQTAFCNYDAAGILECLDENVRYNAPLSGTALTNKYNTIDRLMQMFDYLRENEAVCSEAKVKAHRTSFSLSYTVERYQLITQYMVSPEGIFLVPCFEPCMVQMNIEVLLKVKGHKIKSIEIIQDNKILCRLNAQVGLKFAMSIL